MLVLFEPVREAEGECTWESCAVHDAQAWRVTLRDNVGHGSSWTYTNRKRAAIAARDLAEGRLQPLSVTNLAQLSPKTVYIA